tara:strand:- start:1855 stop:2226 length:372 start_codon:yes stop_codon:yes gene_type:complete
LDENEEYSCLCCKRWSDYRCDRPPKAIVKGLYIGTPMLVCGMCLNTAVQYYKNEYSPLVYWGSGDEEEQEIERLEWIKTNIVELDDVNDITKEHLDEEGFEIQAVFYRFKPRELKDILKMVGE